MRKEKFKFAIMLAFIILSLCFAAVFVSGCKKPGTGEKTAEHTKAPAAENTDAPSSEPSEATETPSATQSAEITAEPSEAPAETPTEAPESTPTTTPTADPTSTPTATPTATPTPKPTATPTPKPTATPTPKPTSTPTPKPTAEPEYAFEGIVKTDYSNYGFQVADDGTIMLGDDKFYGFGVNWHGAFERSLNIQNKTSITLLESYFANLQENNIPCVRIMMGIFYPTEVDMYVKEGNMYHDKFIKAMDRVVGLAEKYNIGIIASLMWNDGTFFAYYGEDLTKLGDPNAQGTKLAVKYVTEIVGRYKYSPAIWAWEIGNEGNLGVDLWPENGTVHSTAQLMAYYTQVSAAIRAQDPYRMICGGDSAPRGSSWALRHNHSWYPTDDNAKTKETIECYTCGDLDTVSLHIYEYVDADRMDDMVKAAKNLKVGLYVGEFGAGSYTAAGDPKSEVDCWNHVVDRLLANDCQVCMQWCWGRSIEIEDGTSIEVGLYNGFEQNVYMLDRIKEINSKFVKEGKNKSASYWSSVTDAIVNK